MRNWTIQVYSPATPASTHKWVVLLNPYRATVVVQQFVVGISDSRLKQIFIEGGYLSPDAGVTFEHLDAPDPPASTG